MMQRLSDLAQSLHADLHGADRPFMRVISDTRKLEAGDLYVALKGEHFDGHEFLAMAQEKGAAGALVSQVTECGLSQVCVEDSLNGLQNFSAAWRGKFDLPVVAVTGSNGKTTTKEMLSSIFNERGPVLATQGNLNNHIGVPLTLLSLRAEHRTAVIEMGANHRGEIGLLTHIARPDVGVVTQAGDAHLEGFGTREGVARGKGELFAGLCGGVAVINQDDAYAPLWRELAGQNSKLSFGFSEDADVQAINPQPYPPQSPSGMRFTLQAQEGRQTVNLPLPGRHNVSNALAAAACAVALGMDLKDIANGLARMQIPPGRLNWKTTPEGARVIDDTYNANPTSLTAALELLASQPGERWLILGSMAELGADSPRLHFEAGQQAKRLGIDRLFTCGNLASEAMKGFGPGASWFEDVTALADAAGRNLSANVVMLVKGSRSARMERVVTALTRAEQEITGGAH